MKQAPIRVPNKPAIEHPEVPIMELRWRFPGDIDGEPPEVRAATVEQLQVFADVLGQLVVDSAVQLRNAGITGRPGRTVEEVTLESWTESDEGEQVQDLVYATKRFREAVKALFR